MFARLYKLAVVLALVLTIGLHWAFLQSLAWTGMVVNYAQTAGLREALVKTFDGKHPCALCKHIDQAKKSEKKTCLKSDGKKFEFISRPQVFVFSPAKPFIRLASPEAFAPERSLAPLPPPPRLG